MDNLDLFQYVAYGLLFPIGYIGITTTAQIISSKFSEQIKDLEELEFVIKEEAKKLGIENKTIKGSINDEHFSFCVKYQNGSYEIILGSNGKTKANVKHELYHIYRGDLEKNGFNLLKYFFKEEPRAVLYQIFGIKL